MEIDGILALVSFAALIIVWAFAPNSAKEAAVAVAAPQKALA